MAAADAEVKGTASAEYTAYVAELKAKGILNGEKGKRPAYEYPKWYRRDGKSCRFCKSVTHNTAVCTKLYKRENDGKEMPKSLIESNQRILDAQDDSSD